VVVVISSRYGYDARQHCPGGVQDRAAPPARLVSMVPPVHHHAGLGQGEGQEHPDGVHREEAAARRVQKTRDHQGGDFRDERVGRRGEQGARLTHPRRFSPSTTAITPTPIHVLAGCMDG
jgi:hypothetical protein